MSYVHLCQRCGMVREGRGIRCHECNEALRTAAPAPIAHTKLDLVPPDMRAVILGEGAPGFVVVDPPSHTPHALVAGLEAAIRDRDVRIAALETALRTLCAAALARAGELVQLTAPDALGGEVVVREDAVRIALALRGDMDKARKVLGEAGKGRE